MTKEEILQYIKSELDNNENAEIYLDVDDYKVIVEALEQESSKDAVKKMFASGLLKDCETCKTMQEPILDKIRAEIEKKIIKRPWLDFEDRERDRNDAFLEVLDIIDKYKAESEEN